MACFPHRPGRRRRTASTPIPTRFRDRAAAGRALAESLTSYAGQDDVIVLGLPRGGVPVAAEIARALLAPLDLMLVRKLGVPGHEELAMGAIASGGVRVLNSEVVAGLEISESAIDRVATEEKRELQRREREYRGDRPPPQLQKKTVILVDDGLATGATMRAAVTATREHHPGRVVVAIPVAPEETCRELEQVADEVVCLSMPEPFMAIGIWYQQFGQVSDQEVRELLRSDG